MLRALCSSPPPPQVPLPAVLKMESGMSSRGVRHVRTREEAAQHVQHVEGLWARDQTLSTELVLMKRVLGTESLTNVIGKCCGHFAPGSPTS